jgi:hypothetical protein
MAIQHNRNIAITLLFSLVILLALAPPSFANPVAPDRRDHVNLNRMIKRRAPLALLPRQRVLPSPQGGAVGAAGDPPTDSPSPVASSTAAAPSVTPAQQSSQSPQPIPSAVSSVLSSVVSCFPFFFLRYFRVAYALNRLRLFRLRPARAQLARLAPPHPLQLQRPPPQPLPPLLCRAPQRRHHRQISSPLQRVNPSRLTR